MKKDTLFRENSDKQDFLFNDQVADVFDDMLTRSVPCYAQVIDITSKIISKLVRPGDTIYDLGCSTGTTLLELSRRLSEPEVTFIGIDTSAAMLNRATHKAEMYSQGNRIQFIEQDITKADFTEAGVILLNYTLQFIRPPRRQDFMNRIARSLRPGGVLIVSEKVISHSPRLNPLFIDAHLDFKRKNGYSETEISRKRESLENVLIPFSIQENHQMMAQAGLTDVDTFFQWFNFASIMAIKG
ncbi:MAG: carboxy-S-adenosyl-L-methionine synthase CmoA [Proteobacteria bacterium]|nr:carboxy-S-adenosyl-L-methionine synthase CmoA [Pseudomonadota bacterium]MBU1685834.1 carboxy-S-adenosyl-L-methionine synthase CmoA [Pseudomonadota bacterium]